MSEYREPDLDDGYDDYGDSDADSADYGRNPHVPRAAILRPTTPTVAAGSSQLPTPALTPLPAPFFSRGGQRPQARPTRVTTSGWASAGGPAAPRRSERFMFAGPAVNTTNYRPSPLGQAAVPVALAPAVGRTLGRPVFGNRAGNMTRAPQASPPPDTTYNLAILQRSPEVSQITKRPTATRPGGLSGTPTPAKKSKPLAAETIDETTAAPTGRQPPPVAVPRDSSTSHFTPDSQRAGGPRHSPSGVVRAPTSIQSGNYKLTLFGSQPDSQLGRPADLATPSQPPPAQPSLPANNRGQRLPTPPTDPRPADHRPGAGLSDEEVRRRLFMAEIESIRRPQPLYQGQAVMCRVEGRRRSTDSTATAAATLPPPHAV